MPIKWDAIDKAVRAQGASVIKPHQVQALIIAASRAYKVQKQIGLVGEDDSFDVWRKATIHDIVGAAAPSSFRAVTNREYPKLLAYFEHLAGGAGNPDYLKIEKLDEWQRAFWRLSRTEERLAPKFGSLEDVKEYANALFRDIHKTDRVSADARQIWAVIITLRKRAKSPVRHMKDIASQQHAPKQA